MSDAPIERRMILQLLAGEVAPSALPGSTSRLIAAFLAVGRFESLPEPYCAKEDAWARLNAAQRDIVREFNPTFRNPRWNTPVHYG
jgi:hypothetical protein